MATVAYGSLPFSEQIRFLRSKPNVLTESWLDVYGAEHDAAFMVAGANRADLVADFNAAIGKAIADGATLAEFRRDFDRIVATYGWDYNGGRNWRSRVIYETNLRQSYNAGRWEQLQRLKRVRPYWRYRHSDAVEHPRPVHLSWDGLVLHADDPWWWTHFPANGWGCQCYVEALSERDLRSLGKSGPDQAPPIEMEKVIIGQRSPGGPREVWVPKGIDPGFDYAPGRSRTISLPPGDGPRTPPSLSGQLELAAQTAIEKTARLPAQAAAQSVEQLLSLERATTAVDAGYAQWQSEVMALRQARNHTYMVGAIEPDIVTSMATEGIEPLTSAIVARDREILHALRDAKSVISSITATQRAVAADELARLPKLLRESVAILLDTTDEALLYIVNASERREAAKIIVAVNYRLKMETGRAVTNSFRTASLIDLADIRAEVAAGRLKLLRGSLE